MAHRNWLRVFTYDVSSNKRRRKVSRILEDQASRVQLSVFEGRLSDHSVKKIVERIEGLLEKGDSLRVYSIGKNGERYCRVYGDGVPVEKENAYWLF